MGSSAIAGMGSSNAGNRWKQVLFLGLAAIPIAERLLLYHVAMTVWAMLPGRYSGK
ncbi:MAG: hypothetical protein WA510_06960 [Acidobacteriaceae bacterium]